MSKAKNPRWTETYARTTLERPERRGLSDSALAPRAGREPTASALVAKAATRPADGRGARLRGGQAWNADATSICHPHQGRPHDRGVAGLRRHGAGPARCRRGGIMLSLPPTVRV